MSRSAGEDTRFLPLSPLSASILLALGGGPLHGYGLIKELERQSGGRRAPGAGSLYAALQRMVDEGLLEEREPTGGDERRSRAYALSALGRRVARLEVGRMMDLVELAAEHDLAPGGTAALRRARR